MESLKPVRTNNNIQSINIPKDKTDRKIINVKSKLGLRSITVPIDAPEIDPYDKDTGKGFMIPNAIIHSGLSANAKLMFCSLRSFISYDLGVVFPNREIQLEQAMSKSCSSNDKAVKELEHCGVISTVKMSFQGHLKIYYYLESEDKWTLPEPKQFC